MPAEDWLVPAALADLGDAARRAIYEVIALRRDIRHFEPGAVVDDEVLRRILGAAHLAPSVGFSQPWGFVLVRDPEKRRRVRESFLRCREAEAARFPPEQRARYLALRLEGIVESSLNLCVAVDLRPRDEAILGTTVQPEAVRASACCAVQNLWLAARAEGVGVGWVSIVEPAVLRAELALPPGVEPIAYLCVGRARAFREKPMLEESGWGARRSLDAALHAEGVWRDRAPPPRPSLVAPSSGPSGVVAPFDEAAASASRVHQATLTKPVGSLGRLEELAVWWSGARGHFPAPVPRLGLTLFAADHGVVVEAVSAYPSSATAAMVANVLAGGSAISALSSLHDVDLRVVDVGVAGDDSAFPTVPLVPFTRRAARRGTRNLRHEPAMTPNEVSAAMTAGAESLRALAAAGVTLVAAGEIGIGNTTAATAIVCAMTGIDVQLATGRGTGLDAAGVERKAAVIRDALALHRPRADDPLGVLACFGGLEIAAMTGFVEEAARHRIPVVLDGLIAGAAALIAVALHPAVGRYLVASHRSAEPAADAALRRLDLVPLFDLSLRLGEGTGAVLGMHLVRASVATQLAMATFATSGVVGRAGTQEEIGS